MEKLQIKHKQTLNKKYLYHPSHNDLAHSITDLIGLFLMIYMILPAEEVNKNMSDAGALNEELLETSYNVLENYQD